MRKSDRDNACIGSQKFLFDEFALPDKLTVASKGQSVVSFENFYALEDGPFRRGLSLNSYTFCLLQ